MIHSNAGPHRPAPYSPARSTDSEVLPFTHAVSPWWSSPLPGLAVDGERRPLGIRLQPGDHWTGAPGRRQPCVWRERYRAASTRLPVKLHAPDVDKIVYRLLTPTACVSRRASGSMLNAGATCRMIRDRTTHRIHPRWTVEQRLPRLSEMSKERMVPSRGEDIAHSRRCESLVEHAFDVIAIVDPDGAIMYTSPSTYAVLGYHPEETIGWDGDRLVHPDDRQEVVKIREHLVRYGGRCTPAQLRLRHAKGEWRIVEMVAENLLDDPDIRGIVVNWRDVTELRRIEERYEKSFSCNPDAVTITSLKDGQFLVVNEGFEEICGYTRDEVSEKSVYDVSLWKRPSDRDRLTKLLEESRSVRNFEAEFVVKSGEVRTGLLSAEVIELEEEPCVLMVTRDVTDIKLANKRLRESANRLAEEHREVIRKNVALNEVLKHLEHEKTVFRHEVSANLENLLRPLIDSLESDRGKLTLDDVDKIRVGLQRVLGEEIDDFQSNLTKLTPRELDVCELIRRGCTTKEIADELHLSPETVRKHRQSIRKKLQIDRRGLSLASYLRTRM